MGNQVDDRKPCHIKLFKLINENKMRELEPHNFAAPKELPDIGNTIKNEQKKKTDVTYN